ncbi:hypothetical protein LSPH26S_04754 [Lysinibacillus sphaericus]
MRAARSSTTCGITSSCGSTMPSAGSEKAGADRARAAGCRRPPARTRRGRAPGRARGRPRRASRRGSGRPSGCGRPGRRPAEGSAARCCTGRPTPGAAARPGVRRRRAAGRSPRRGCPPARERSAVRGTGSGAARGPHAQLCSSVHRMWESGMRDDRGRASKWSGSARPAGS